MWKNSWGLFALGYNLLPKNMKNDARLAYGNSNNNNGNNSIDNNKEKNDRQHKSCFALATNDASSLEKIENSKIHETRNQTFSQRATIKWM